jgi:pimeloyl-ACP methyl ester carboxylesterase
LGGFQRSIFCLIRSRRSGGTRTACPTRRCFRKYQPPTLIVWGKNDFIFPAEGAAPYKRDLKNVETHLLDTGHFALETLGEEIASRMGAFLQKQKRTN